MNLPNSDDLWAEGKLFIATCIIAGLIVLLMGCTQSRVVEIPGAAPPPTVQTVTDTLYLASPPDTVFAPPDTVEVLRTVPYEVVRYLAPRPDTARAFLLWHLSVDSARVGVSGADADLSLRRPEPGEALVCVAQGPSDLECRVEGEPVAPPVQRVECPACDPLIPRGARGWLTLVGVILVSAAIGATATALLR